MPECKNKFCGIGLPSHFSFSFMQMPQAPVNISAEFTDALSVLGHQWSLSELRPKIDPEIARKWDELIGGWIASDIPLLIRKGNLRGRVHLNGKRKFITVDNSPAQWAFALAFGGSVPVIDDIRNWLVGEGNMPPTNEEIPIAMVVSRSHQNDPTLYRKQLPPGANVNKLNWKLAHIDGVGIRFAGEIEELKFDSLISHFKKLMSPSNMFVIPKHLAGLAEVPEFIKHFRDSAVPRPN